MILQLLSLMHLWQRTFLNYFTSFKTFKGLELNKFKTEGMWLGSCKYNTLTPFDVAWPSEPIYVLGNYFSYNEDLSFQKTILSKN